MLARTWTRPPPQKGKRGSFFIRRAPTPFAPKENGCPVRVLVGAEFAARKRELEACDRAERARVTA